MKPAHPLYSVLAWSAGCLAGVLAARFVPLPALADPLWLVVGVGGLLLSLWQQRRWLIALACVCGLLAGLCRGTAVRLPEITTGHYRGQTVTIHGRINGDPSANRSGGQTMQLAVATIQNQPAGGHIWLTTHAHARLQRGSHVVVRGKLSPGFGVFAGAMYRARIIQATAPQGDIFLPMRDWFAGRLFTWLPNDEAALAAGFLLGHKTALSNQLDEAMRTVGLTHIVVASGYNLTILVRLGRRLFARHSRKIALVAGLSLVAVFIAITGASPSMVRAGMVAALSMAAWFYGREVHPLTLLIICAAASVLIQPRYIWGDLGWLLSFAAFGGVMFLAPLLQHYFYGQRRPQLIPQIMTETFSAQIFTLPITLYVFGSVSIVALIANLLVLPFIPLIMLLSAIGGLLGPLVITPAHWLLSYVVMVVYQLASVPWATLELRLPISAIIGLYLGLGVMLWWLQRRTQFSWRSVNITR